MGIIAVVAAMLVMSVAECFTWHCRILQLCSQAPRPQELASDQALTRTQTHQMGRVQEREKEKERAGGKERETEGERDREILHLLNLTILHIVYFPSWPSFWQYCFTAIGVRLV